MDGKEGEGLSFAGPNRLEIAYGQDAPFGIYFGWEHPPDIWHMLYVDGVSEYFDGFMIWNERGVIIHLILSMVSLWRPCHRSLFLLISQGWRPDASSVA